MYRTICLLLLVLLPTVCFAVIYHQSPVTKGPQRNVLTADLTIEERQGKNDGLLKEKRVIAVYSGKAKPSVESTTSLPMESTTTLASPIPKTLDSVGRSSKTNSIDDSGCLVAVESPIYQPMIVHHARAPKKPIEWNLTTTTQSPNIFSHARGYIAQKFRKIKDHVGERMVMFYLSRAPPRPFVPPSTVGTTTQRTTTTTVEPTTEARRIPFKPTCPKPNGLFPHEEDCSRFINCWRGTPHVQKCAHGTLFSPADGSCEHAANVVCQTRRSGILTTKTPSTTTTRAPPLAETRKAVSCPEPRGIFPYEGDCKKYIYCIKNRPQVQYCLEGTLFNSASKECEDAQQVQCQLAASATPANEDGGVGRSANARYRALDNLPQNRSVSCPRRKGLFPYEGDCKKFINCWAGKAHVQTCAEGTLFNPLTLECDHSAKVKCLSPTAIYNEEAIDRVDESSESSTDSLRSSAASARRLNFKRAPLSPDSGQRIRLRGGAGPWEGYVEVRAAQDKPWGHVCDSSNSWTIYDANVICRTLGFLRGAQQSVQGLDFGPITLDRVLIERVECSGSETNLTECKVHTGPNCQYINEQVVGVRCHRDPQSLCGTDEYAHGNACYKFVPDQLVTRETARSLCEENGGHLLQILSQSESDFISELLLSVAPSVTRVHTDGVATKVMKKNWLVWEHNLIAMNFTKWWPDWNRTRTGNPNPETSSECVLLRNRFEYQNQCAVLPYFFWTLGDCGVAAAVVCKKVPRDIGCIFGNGADYQGTANVSQSGTPCLTWSDPRIRHIQAKPSRAALIRSDSAKPENRISAGSSLRHNYCRNPHGESKPWCFISPHEMEFCDIPMCPTLSRPAALRAPPVSAQCKPNQYKCNSGECIPNTWVCDGAADCDGGSDEDNCIQYMSEFYERANETLQHHDREKWLHTTLETCARRCAEAKSFTCMSFNYNDAQSECILTSNNRGNTGDMIQSLGWSYYERKIYSVNCTSEHFECPTGKCLNQTAVCDGINDCGDRADENICRSQVDFQIRLAGGNRTGEGRVEVKVFGQWGSVCDDSFGMNDANVICRQLGFTLGASEAFSHSAFGPGSPILMDDIQCHGNETSLSDCKFAGWGVHNCNPEETAGVRCNVPVASCSEGQWKCQSTDSCIAINFLCDTVDDCGDHSDENRTICDSELLVRLADGPDLMSGRVEIRRNGVWGTICDDDFSAEDATVICRMMGLNGPAHAVTGGAFGPGKGPIWLDEVGCTGTETTLMECSRLPWAQHNCRHAEDVGVRCSKEDELITSRELPAVNQISDLVNSGTLPARCGLRIADDNPSDPLGQPKIVKGLPTQPGAYPWQVGVRVKGSGRSDSSHWCGASIISEYFLITAAHCMEDFPKGLYVLRVGDHNTRDPDPEEEEFGVDRLFFHEEFSQGGHLNHDIALVRIKAKGGRGIRFGSHVQPICLPPPTAEYSAGLNCTISGWGLPGQPGQEYAIRLQSATVPMMADETCKASHVYGPERIKNGMFCAGYIEGGVDSCQGDSGGGLVCLIDGRPTLMGVTSWGFGCGRPNRPGVYTRVVQYLPWIFSKLADTSL